MIEAQRIDKWLWHARFAKTRTAAQKLAISGQIRVNRDKNDSASRIVKIGDVLTVAQGSVVRVVRIAGIGERRGPATEAQRLYDEVTPPLKSTAPAAPAPVLSGARPNKRDRRALQELKRSGTTE